MSLVVPAVLPASRTDLEEKLALFASIPSVSRIQVDVVDGKFAAPASWPYSPPSPKATGGHSATTQGAPYSELETMVQKGEMLPQLDRFEYEIDLMCLDALDAAEAWLAQGATRLTFHAESTTDLPRMLSSAHGRYGGVGLISIGLALNVTGDLAFIEPNLEQVEYVQFMGIAQIGRQGQPFDDRVLEKVRIFRSRHPEIAVQVDGGISLTNAKKLVALDVSNLVIGSGILKAKNPAAEVAKFEALQTSYGV